MLSTCGFSVFCKIIVNIYYFVVVVITIFQNSQGNHVTVFTVVELYFMCTVDSLLLTIARSCMCIHFLFVFPILIAMLLRLRYGSFHLQDVAIKHSKFAFLYSGLRPEKNLNKQQNYWELMAELRKPFGANSGLHTRSVQS